MKLISESRYRLTSPCVDPETGAILAVCSVSGTVLVLKNPNDLSGGSLSFQPIAETNGQPTGLAIDTHHTDATSISLIAADPTSQSVLPFDLPKSSVKDVTDAEANGTDGELPVLSIGMSPDSIHTFEGRTFLGPRCVAVDHEGELIFTDPGMPGDSSLTNPRGSVYRTINRRQQLTKLISSSLAMPTGIASVNKGQVIYIAEMGTNRVLRLVKQPEGGYYYCGVFLQLSGSMGPVAIVVHPITGDIFIAQYDIKAVTERGSIYVFYSSGELKGTIAVPSPQISGIAFDRSYTQLYITTENAGGEPSRLYSTSVEDGDGMA
eukprot:Tbor_TRINITY_DN4338_c0_g1::TRINITY_DN4338_c0_g1_i1::g.7684::m.7684/K01053/E3.1.1.17, gnl, RGN; gluconolactonase